MSELLTPTNSKGSKNAIKHGLYSSTIVLKWEDASQFEQLYQALKEEYDPQGRSEEDAIFELASLHWKKRRLSIGSQLAIHSQAGAGELADAASKGGWEGIDHILSKSDADDLANCVRDMAKAQAEAARGVYEIILKHVKQTNDPAETNVDTTDSIEKVIILAKELNLIGSELVVPMMRAIESGSLTQSAERTYRPDLLEKELKLQAEINRQIDKVLKRLVATKEFKRMYSPKLVQAK